MTLFEDEGTAPTGPTGPSVRVRLLVAYDGRGFSGFAVNPGVTTVGGTLVAAIERVLRHPVTITCAGRTDAGVHGWGQVVTFDASAEGLDLVALQRSVNKLCAPRIVVREADVAPAGFDARHSATARHYRYTVVNRPVPDPFLVGTAWHVAAPLDLASMRLGCDPLIGEHDFASFCRRPRVGAEVEPPSLVRRVTDARWLDLGEGVLRFEISASSFCQQMVRAVVGTLVEVGFGRKRAGDVRGILDARDRSRAGELAPPHGLCLWHVSYPDGPAI
ncbi:MAG TPA: tRNA pseudouridine(38-40) synthase TruA [Acidimicrobiales bacterium]|nr:tRNA pseudouridine(38-40) synthase TruA [Acidimicrobiales bacterium]